MAYLRRPTPPKKQQRLWDEAGLCPYCGNDRDSRFKMCSICRAANQANAKLIRVRRIAKKLCVRCGEPAVPNHLLCVRHRDSERIRIASAQQRKRQRYKEEGRCTDCGSSCLGRRQCERCAARAHLWVVNSRSGELGLDAFLGRMVSSLSSNHRMGKRPIVMLSADELHGLWDRQRGLCAYSALPMLASCGSLCSTSIDRIDQAIHCYRLDNIQLTCRWANLGRNNHTDAAFRAVLDMLSREHRETTFSPSSQLVHNWVCATQRRWKDDNTLVNADLKELWAQQRGLCALSRLPMIWVKGSLLTVSVDRIDNNVGYHRDNIQLVCRWVNVAKGPFGNSSFLSVLDEYRALHANP